MVLQLGSSRGVDRLRKGVGEWQAALPLPLDGIGRGPCFWQTLASHWQCSGMNAFWQATTLLLVSLCGFPLCFFSFSVAISDCSSDDGGAEAWWRLSDGSQMAPGLNSGRFRLSKHYIICMIHPFYCSVRVFRLFGLWAYHPAIDCRISPSPEVSLCRSKSVQSVGCQLFSPAMKDVREGLCDVSGAVRTNW